MGDTTPSLGGPILLLGDRSLLSEALPITSGTAGFFLSTLCSIIEGLGPLLGPLLSLWVALAFISLGSFHLLGGRALLLWTFPDFRGTFALLPGVS